MGRLFRAISAIQFSLGRTVFVLGCIVLRGGDRAHRLQLYVQVPQDAEQAVQARLVGHPAAQIGQTLRVPHDLESIYCSDERGGQPASDDYFKSFSTHRDSFRIHEADVRSAAIDRTRTRRFTGERATPLSRGSTTRP